VHDEQELIAAADGVEGSVPTVDVIRGTLPPFCSAVMSRRVAILLELPHIQIVCDCLQCFST